MPSSAPAAILFDIDGTLLDDDRAVLLALTAFHAVHGSELGFSLEALAARWKELLAVHLARYLAGEVSMQEQRRARVRELFARAKPDLCAAEADSIFAAYEGHYRNSWSAFPDAVPALAALRGFALGVLTNGDAEQQTQKLKQCGLAPHFSGVFVSSEIGCAKPAAEAFRIACSRLGVPPGRCVFVGDHLETDARAAAAAGLTGVWLDRAGASVGLSYDVPVIHSLSELPAFLGALTE